MHLLMIPPKRRLWQRVWAGLSAAAVGLVGVCAWPYTVDDAFIVARYAQRVAHGLGYGFNSGPSADGITAPAWLLPGICAVRLQLDPVLIAKLCGLVASAIAALLSVAAVGHRARGRVLVPLAAGLLACEPTLACAGVSGLETGAACLLTVIAAHAALRRPEPRPLRAGLAIGSLAWLRPELAFAGGVLLVALTRRLGARRAAPAWSCAVGLAAAVCVFRFALTQDVLPLALRAKPAELGNGLEYCLRALFVLCGGGGVLLAIAGASLGRSDDRWLGALLLAHCAACWLAGGDWMPGFRLFAPVLPLYAALAAVGFERAWRRAGAARMFAGLGLACALAVPLLDLATRLPELRSAGASRERVGRELAAWLRAHTSRVALVDIGFLGYASEREIVDLGGITDPEVASFPGGHLGKRLPDGWLERRAPDALVLHSSLPPTAAADGRLISLRGYPVEMRAAQDPWVQRHFRVAYRARYAPDYFYVALLREDR
jgi:arabinofuranosyltransferase